MPELIFLSFIQRASKEYADGLRELGLPSSEASAAEFGHQAGISWALGNADWPENCDHQVKEKICADCIAKAIHTLKEK